MRDYGKISGRFWTGATGRSLRGDPACQVLAVYLVTAPSANMIGLYYLPIPIMAHETGLAPPEIERCLDKLEGLGFAHYDKIEEVVYVVTMASAQIAEGLQAADKRVKGIEREALAYQRSPLCALWWGRYQQAFGLPDRTWSEAPSKGSRSPFEGQSKPLRSPFEAPSKGDLGAEKAPSKGLLRPAEAPSKPLRSQDQDQDQEQEKKLSLARAREAAAPAPTPAPVPTTSPTPVRAWGSYTADDYAGAFEAITKRSSQCGAGEQAAAIRLLLDAAKLREVDPAVLAEQVIHAHVAERGAAGASGKSHGAVSFRRLADVEHFNALLDRLDGKAPAKPLAPPSPRGSPPPPQSQEALAAEAAERRAREASDRAATRAKFAAADPPPPEVRAFVRGGAP